MAEVSPTPPELNFGRIDALPRARLVAGPTVIEPMPNLRRDLLSGPLYVKRDDLTGFAFGGNKIRQLEFYFGEAQAQEADVILITSAVQSNFARLTAAAARRLDMDCHVQLEERVPDVDQSYRNSGNVLLDRLLGATIHSYPDGEDEAGADARIREIADDLTAAGRRPYIIPLAPGSPPKGALGYVLAAREILDQAAADGTELDEIVAASGSGHTHAGLLFGLRAAGSAIRLTGICVRRDAQAQRPRIRDHCARIAQMLQIDNPVTEADIVLDDSHVAPGYGRPGEAALEALLLAARTEALILDPIYTAKVMAGFIDRVRDGGSDRSLMFLHSGGTPALFAYAEKLTPLLTAE